MGGNTEGTAAALNRARRFLGSLLFDPAFSSLYRTAPQLDHNQDDFWNSVISGSWNGSPESLLERLLMWEYGAGRSREASRPKGPRVIDLDLLLCDDQICSTARLTLPHPQLHLRRFALEPLLELDPGLRDPRTDRPWRESLQNLPDQGVDRTDRSW